MFSKQVFDGAFKDVSIKCQESFTGVSRNFQGCFKEDRSVFKAILRKFQRSVNVSKVLQGNFRSRF